MAIKTRIIKDLKIQDCSSGNLLLNFSPTKRKILLTLKRKGEIDLESLSLELGISKMGVLKHIRDLEELGFVKRSSKKIGVGRPRLVLSLTAQAAEIFPHAYAKITLFAFKYIEEKLGKKGVEDLLKRIFEENYHYYQERIKGSTFEERLKEFAALRDQSGYMVQVKNLKNGDFEFSELNCPIHVIADNYKIACKYEMELFKVISPDIKLKRKIEHGKSTCKFILSKS